MWAVLYEISNQSEVIHQRYERKGWAVERMFFADNLRAIQKELRRVLGVVL